MPPKLQRSNFFFTINPNKRITNDDNSNNQKIEDEKLRLQQIFDKLIGSYEAVKNYLIFLDDKKQETKKDFSKIKTVKIDRQVEYGHENQCCHLHALICFSHYTKLLLDYKKINADFCKELGLDSIHIYTRIFDDQRSAIEDYINKTKIVRNRKIRSYFAEKLGEPESINEPVQDVVNPQPVHSDIHHPRPQPEHVHPQPIHSNVHQHDNPKPPQRVVNNPKPVQAKRSPKSIQLKKAPVERFDKPKQQVSHFQRINNQPQREINIRLSPNIASHPLYRNRFSSSQINNPTQKNNNENILLGNRGGNTSSMHPYLRYRRNIQGNM
jgi:hypothetical protein